MGIREYFKQHPEGEDLKLQNMVIKEKEPKEELWFDAERDISDEAIENWQKKLELYRQNKDWFSFVSLAVSFKILFPDKFSELNLDKGAIEDMKHHIKQLSENDSMSFVSQATFFKILFPDKFSELNLGQEVAKNLREKIEGYRQNNQWFSFTFEAMYFKILFPDKISELKINPKTIGNMEYQLEHFRQNKEWLNYIYQAMCLRILFPNRILGQEAIGIMKVQVEENQQRNWKNFIGLAEWFKILAAKEVRVTDQGLEIIMPERKPEKEKRSSRPERRTF